MPLLVFRVILLSHLVTLSTKCLHRSFKIKLHTLSWTCNMISTPSLSASLVAHALFMTSVQVKTNFPPKSLKCIFLGYSHTQKGHRYLCPQLQRYIVSSDVTFFEPHSFSLPSCYLMTMVLQMLEISLLSFLHPLHLNCRPTSDGHLAHQRLEMILIHQHHLLLL